MFGVAPSPWFGFGLLGVKVEEFLPLPAFSGGRLSRCGGDGCKADAVVVCLFFALFFGFLFLSSVARLWFYLAFGRFFASIFFLLVCFLSLK